MVGERYRDLIEAADTIHQMRQCTSSVIQSLTSMQTSCNGLRGARQGIIDREKYGKKTSNVHLNMIQFFLFISFVKDQ